jgi:hypothetical protein
MRLTPFLVARSQLLTAIDLFVGDRDSVSVQALAGNAREILERLCRQNDIAPMTELLLKDHPNKPKKDIYTALNLYRNCFKHLGETVEERHEDQLKLNQFDDTKNDYLLYVCVEDYIRFRKSMPVAMQVFQFWFCALHADLLAPEFHAEQFLSVFPDIQNMSRLQQKRALVACIEHYSRDAELLADPATEPLFVDR